MSMPVLNSGIGPVVSEYKMTFNDFRVNEYCTEMRCGESNVYE